MRLLNWEFRGDLSGSMPCFGACGHPLLHLLLVVPLLSVSLVHGYDLFVNFIPNGNRVPDPCGNGTSNWGPVGHQGFVKRSPLNPFGVDFLKNGRSWNEHFCKLDSDGDGKTNGEELGDPNCTWTSSGRTPAASNNLISHPGICEPLQSPNCLRRNSWLNNCQMFTCPEFKKPGVHSLLMSFSQEISVPGSFTPGKTINRVEKVGGGSGSRLAPDSRIVCLRVNLPADKDYHVIGSHLPLGANIPGLITDATLFGCRSDDDSRSGKDSEFDCEVYPKKDRDRQCLEMIASWNKRGAVGECHPEEYGFRIGRRSFRKAVLRVHLHNNHPSVSVKTDAGLVIYYTDRLRPNDAGTLVLSGSISYDSHYHVSRQYGRCSRNCTKKLPTSINIAQIAITTDDLEADEVAIRLETADGEQKPVKELLNWKHFKDPNVKRLEIPLEFHPNDELVIGCKSSTAGIDRCLAKIIYYPSIRGFHSCFDSISEDVCPLPTVNFSCSLHSLIQQTKDVLGGCPSLKAECANHCEMVMDQIAKSGCSKNDLELYSQTFPQTPQFNWFIDSMKDCSILASTAVSMEQSKADLLRSSHTPPLWSHSQLPITSTPKNTWKVSGKTFVASPSMNEILHIAKTDQENTSMHPLNTWSSPGKDQNGDTSSSVLLGSSVKVDVSLTSESEDSVFVGNPFATDTSLPQVTSTEDKVTVLTLDGHLSSTDTMLPQVTSTEDKVTVLTLDGHLSSTDAILPQVTSAEDKVTVLLTLDVFGANTVATDGDLSSSNADTSTMANALFWPPLVPADSEKEFHEFNMFSATEDDFVNSQNTSDAVNLHSIKNDKSETTEPTMLNSRYASDGLAVTESSVVDSAAKGTDSFRNVSAAVLLESRGSEALETVQYSNQNTLNNMESSTPYVIQSSENVASSEKFQSSTEFEEDAGSLIVSSSPSSVSTGTEQSTIYSLGVTTDEKMEPSGISPSSLDGVVLSSDQKTTTAFHAAGVKMGPTTAASTKPEVSKILIGGLLAFCLYWVLM